MDIERELVVLAVRDWAGGGKLVVIMFAVIRTLASWQWQREPVGENQLIC